MYVRMLFYTIVLVFCHHLFTCVCQYIYYYCHILTYIHPHIHTQYLSSPPAILPRHDITVHCILRLPYLTYHVQCLSSSISSLLYSIDYYSNTHTHTSPPPGDLTLQYLQPYVSFRAYCIFSLPHHYPPLFLLTPFSLAVFSVAVSL